MQNSGINLDEALNQYLNDNSNKKIHQNSLVHFTRWCGKDKLVCRMTAIEVSRYPECISSSDKEVSVKLQSIRAFLTYLNEQGWVDYNLSSHIKIKKLASRKSATRTSQNAVEKIPMTASGYKKLEDELGILKVKRIAVIEEMRLAALDKDMRENAPYHAAKEQRGQIEGRIKEIEHELKHAEVSEYTDNNTSKVNMGNTVKLRDLKNGEQCIYTLVSPKEIEPLKGRISASSPIGKALFNRSKGDNIEIEVPSGTLQYVIEDISFK
ncbi:MULTISPECIES: transcription elongation factor GreA [Dehalococcoides]|jgi:transcription elongation factor GreA|uniref:Transcription elongation factor GreA n=1 Tax=Dehalococcoides mccartyi TaxID=61435 RepID=A0A142VA13_9CHLR|nr:MULTISPECIES: transcription elongation factor GreA [Dehalococcoides]AGG06356.1 transcription elongation factor GreA [Dehalococcoides mccartyi DCMB5]AGG07787.1 transcription elongation factor GreA [Dehalococcoides mccartyi BTF08]AII60818.1 transcription elongation factor GreA [Dehalococcoides mccartyi CG5]AMU86489.1 transcription elongation factor GreA [Dehalococcoides mccartyi]AOV99315.1 transcription elongation factor GreA [Dehalococcoides mccartyi]